MAEEEADFAESDDAGDDMAEEAPADAEAPLPFARVDLLPDALPPVVDADELTAVIAERYIDQVDLEAGVGLTDEERFAGLCPEAIALIVELQPTGTASIELATTELDGAPVTVIVAADTIGGIAVLTHPVDACVQASVQGVIAPS